MESLFTTRSARPMLIGVTTNQPYDDAQSLFELKLDGERCLAYLDKSGTVMTNRRGLAVEHRLPELAGIHRQASARCILDGEVITGTGSIADFEDIKSRMAHRSLAKIDLGARLHPASFVAFDILFVDNKDVTGQPLQARKALLEKTVAESEQMALARTVDGAGIAFYDLVLQQGLEGIIGKNKNSLYTPGKRTKEWVKVKNVQEDDYVICGYIVAQHVAMLILGQYNTDGALVYKGRVTLGLRREDFQMVQAAARAKGPLFASLPTDMLRRGEAAGDVVWLKPALVCTVDYLRKTADGLMRQPHYRRLRPDKTPKEAIAAE